MQSPRSTKMVVLDQRQCEMSVFNARQNQSDAEDAQDEPVSGFFMPQIIHSLLSHPQSRQLYIIVFLIIIFLLLAVSSAIVLRTWYLRRRALRLGLDAPAQSSLFPFFTSHNDDREDTEMSKLGRKPEMYEVLIERDSTIQFDKQRVSYFLFVGHSPYPTFTAIRSHHFSTSVHDRLLRIAAFSLSRPRRRWPSRLGQCCCPPRPLLQAPFQVLATRVQRQRRPVRPKTASPGSR